MKKVEETEIVFKRGEIYSIDSTDIIPRSFHAEHFRKPKYKENPVMYGSVHNPNDIDDLSEYDYCIKSITMKYTIYTN